MSKSFKGQLAASVTHVSRSGPLAANISGTGGNDDLDGGVSGDSINGLGGNDTLFGAEGKDTLNGGEGNDLLEGGEGHDVLNGGNGTDAAVYWGAVAGVSVDLAISGSQNTLGAGFDTLIGIEDAHGSSHADSFYGDDVRNGFFGNGGTDSLVGRGGDDWLNGGAGNDTIDGGEGQDTADYWGATASLKIDLNVAGPQNTVGDGIDTLVSIEDVYAYDFNDKLTGNGEANRLFGRGGKDDLLGAGGDDTLGGGLGDNVINGGEGFDYVAFWDATSAIRIDLGVTTRQNTFGGGRDLLISIEGALGSEHDDEIIGSANGDYVWGAGGSDEITGLGGNDTLNGGFNGGADSIDGGEGDDFANGFDGDDVLAGGAGFDFMQGAAGHDDITGGDGDDYLRGDGGNDTVDGGDGWDRAGYFAADVNGAHVDLRLQGEAQDTGIGMDVLIGIEHLSGSIGDDHLIGDDGVNILFGYEGENTLSGNGGDDHLEVGSGDQIIDGGDGIDTAGAYGNGSATLGGVILNLALQGTAQDTGQGLMTLTAIENLQGSIHADELVGNSGANVLAGVDGGDTLRGGGGADRLYGDGWIGPDWTLGLSGPVGEDEALYEEDGVAPAADLLEGGAGADTLVGAAGADTLSGGAQADVFRFVDIRDSAVGARDRITDLAKIDLIDLSGIDADNTLDGDQAFALAKKFTGVAGQAVLSYDSASNITSLSLDVDGDRVADAIIEIAGNARTFLNFEL